MDKGYSRVIALSIVMAATTPAPVLAQGTSPSQGPDVVVGFIPVTRDFGIEEFEAAEWVGIAAGTNSCNRGSSNLNWYEHPDARHPAISTNLYRLANNRIEQVGQSWVKHGF